MRLPAPVPSRGLLGNLWSLLSTVLREPVFKGVLNGLWNDLNAPKPKPRIVDESIADFISRRFVPEVADNIVSAVCHGIYAGDISRLSAQTILPVREVEGADSPLAPSVVGSFVWQWRMGYKMVLADDRLLFYLLLQEKPQSYLSDLIKKILGSSVLTLQNGLGGLSDALLTKLAESDKVDLLPETEVRAISRNANSSSITVSVEQN